MTIELEWKQWCRYSPKLHFLGSILKKIVNSRLAINSNKLASFKILAAEKEIEETQQTDKDRWRGLTYDMYDDQQYITRAVEDLQSDVFVSGVCSSTRYNPNRTMT
ncbi:hypothetical protein L1887_30182 [Cichorium endivia]|nr:hypothetical protein L1887_30182 [Cichorium endivia]